MEPQNHVVQNAVLGPKFGKHPTIFVSSIKYLVSKILVSGSVFWRFILI